MRDVKINYTSSDFGLEFDLGSYIVALGEEFSLTLSWNGDSNQDPDIKWYIQKENASTKTLIPLQKSSKLIHAIIPHGGLSSDTAIGLYTITATADGVECLPPYDIEIETIYANVKNASLIAQGYEDEIAMAAYEVTDIVFEASWNKNCTDNSLVVIEYYEVSEKIGDDFVFVKVHEVDATASDISYTYSPLPLAGEYALKVIVYNENGSSIKSEAIRTINILERYHEVKKLEISVQDGSLHQVEANKDYEQIVLKANPTPINGLNPAAKYNWYVNGVLQSTQSSTFTLTKQQLKDFNENCVWVELAGVKSANITATAFDTSQYDHYLSKKFVWDASEYNYYISSKREFEIVVGNIIMQRLTNIELYFDPSSSGINFTNSSGFMPHLQEAITEGYDESGERNFTYDVQQPQKAVLSWNGETPIAPTKGAYGSQAYPQVSLPVHYLNLPIPRATLPIDDETKTLNVTSSNMLYRVVSWGYKPTFNAIPNESADIKAAREKAQQIYLTAREILSTICSDDMTETEKAHAIFDWIVSNVTYDYELSEATSMTVDESLKYSGFYLEGVFGDERRAVCDGMAKAFTLMCAIECISSCRVIGYVENDPSKGHAWNKVLLDPDGDGIKNWFFVDTTWSNKKYDGKEFALHNYFLRYDAEVYYDSMLNPNGTHNESRAYYPKADGNYNVYAEIEVTAQAAKLVAGNPTVSTLVVTNIEECAVMLAMAQEYGYIEFKVDSLLTMEQLFNQAKNLLVNHSGQWSLYGALDVYYYLYKPPNN